MTGTRQAGLLQRGAQGAVGQQAPQNGRHLIAVSRIEQDTGIAAHHLRQARGAAARHRRYRITEGAEEIQMRKVAAFLFGFMGPKKKAYAEAGL